MWLNKNKLFKNKTVYSWLSHSSVAHTFPVSGGLSVTVGVVSSRLAEDGLHRFSTLSHSLLVYELGFQPYLLVWHFTLGLCALSFNCFYVSSASVLSFCFWYLVSRIFLRKGVGETLSQVPVCLFSILQWWNAMTKIDLGSEYRNSGRARPGRQEPKLRPWRELLTGLHTMACSACYLREPRTAFTGGLPQWAGSSC